jgi:predicted metal-dependent peptidase
MAKLTAEQRIERVHVALMRHKKFCLFSGLFMVGKVTVDDAMPTATTDGINVIYGRGFVDRLDDKQLGFLILHEAMHKAYRHLTTWEKLFKKNAGLANAACDYVINLQIYDYDPDEDIVRFPTDENGDRMGLMDERFRGMDAHQVFTLLEKEEQGRGGSGGSLEIVEGSDNPSDSRNVPQGFDEHLWEQAGQMDEKEAEQIAKEIDNALRQGALLAAKMNGGISREIQELLTPKIDWRDVLRDFIKQVAKGKDDSSWRRYAKRMLGAGIYMPQTISRRLNCIALGIDTSGSIGREELAEFLSEVKSICEEVTPNKVELMYWDSKVAGHETYEDGAVASLTDSTKPRGGGGTDPDCVVKFIDKKQMNPDCVVMLTDGCFYDGEGQWDKVNAPLLWCIKDNKLFTHKYGKAVHL